MLFSLLIKARSLLERIYGGILFIPEKAVEEVITRGQDHFLFRISNIEKICILFAK